MANDVRVDPRLQALLDHLGYCVDRIALMPWDIATLQTRYHDWEAHGRPILEGGKE